MITLRALADLAGRYGADLDRPVPPLVVGGHSYDLAAKPAVMGCINLSRDSTYRESIAVSTGSAIRKGRTLAAQGADFVDLGAESSTARAARVDAGEQLARLRPIVSALAATGVNVSVETYHPEVARTCLLDGARLVNFTGHGTQEAMFDVVAEHSATLVLCYVAGLNVREIADAATEGPVEDLLAHFEPRIEAARARGVTSILVDPGLGFYYGNLVDPRDRVTHQARVLLNTFRLRTIGLPICHAMPHAFDLFEDQYRVAEGFFAVLAMLGGTNVYRTHEVPQVLAVLESMCLLDAGDLGRPGPAGH